MLENGPVRLSEVPKYDKGLATEAMKAFIDNGRSRFKLRRRRQAQADIVSTPEVE